MNFELAIILVLVLGFAMVFYLVRKALSPREDEGMKVMLEWLKEMRGSSESMQKRLDERLGETNKAINERLDNAAKVIGGLQKELGGMTQIGPDLRRLSEVLSSPKARGNFGEEILEELIRQILPRTAYDFQYRFRSGDTVDAVLRIGEQMLPIDSKFSMENFRLYREAKTDESAETLKKAFLKDVKKRVDEIAKKYILPQEGTFDFAYMYIPSEGVFGEILEDAGVCAYAKEKRVYFVSPNSLYHNLQIALLSLRREKVNEAAQRILSMIAGIKQEGEKFGRNLEVLANHLKNAGNTMGTVTRDYEKLKGSIGNAASLKFDSPKEDHQTKLLE